MDLNHSRLTIAPPITANLIKNFDSQIIASDALSTHIIIHPRFPTLISSFLTHKRLHGSSYEKSLYTHSFTWRHQVARLLEKRPLPFMDSCDSTILRNGTCLDDGRKEWDRNGTASQVRNEVLQLEEYLSYDEVMLGSLIGVSGPRSFINQGSRHNHGMPGTHGTFQARGVVIGVVGARFERDGRMDSVYILPTSPETTQHPELIAFFEEFFGARRVERLAFNDAMDMARMRITVDMVWWEANARAGEAHTTAYTYIVGLGLGVWQYNESQPSLYIDTFTAALASRSPATLQHISTIEFAYSAVPPSVQSRVAAAAAPHKITIRFSNRNPAEKVDTEELVLSYAWDGNRMPGNEYWEV